MITSHESILIINGLEHLINLSNYAKKETANFSGTVSNNIMFLNKLITSAELLNLHHRTIFQAHVYPLSECNGSSPWKINIDKCRKEKRKGRKHVIIKAWATYKIIIPWYFASSHFSLYKNSRHLNCLVHSLNSLTKL